MIDIISLKGRSLVKAIQHLKPKSYEMLSQIKSNELVMNTLHLSRNIVGRNGSHCM